MTKEELYINSTFNKNKLIQIIRAEYSNYICMICDKVIGFSNQNIVDSILNKVNDIIDKVHVNCDITSLVFDCTRKEIIKILRTDSVLYKSVDNILLAEADLFSYVSEKDILRLDIVLALMTHRQREYFIKRYYFLDDRLKVNKRYEKAIRKLFAGKGISKYRYEYFNIPKIKVPTNEYVVYLDKMDENFLDYIILESRESKRLSSMVKVSNIVLLAEREYVIAKYSIPISLIIVLCLCLSFILKL